MSMRFRITESPFPRAETPINPDTKVDGFPTSAPTRTAHFNARLAGSNETAAFGYLRERLVGTAGPKDLWLSATCAVLDGERRSRTPKVAAGDFRSRSIDGTAEMFFRNPGTAQSLIRLFQNA